MGPALGSRFHVLWEDTVRLYEYWDEYVALYGTSKERVDLLNQTAQSFFCVARASHVGEYPC